MSTIFGIKALKDNYIWAIHGSDNTQVVVVDPGEAKPVLDYLAQSTCTLAGILLTHHHWDHTNGVNELLQHFPTIPVYSSKIDKVPGATHLIQEGDQIVLAGLLYPVSVIAIPGHTLGHVAYLYGNHLFCGDTLFSCGCGRIFEGTPTQMFYSLQKLKQLPLDTLIYCGHEYTLANIAFAQTIEPTNHLLEQRKHTVKNLRDKQLPSLPVTLDIELQTNPFLRCAEPHIISSAQHHATSKLTTPLEIFTHLREWKNLF